MGTQRSVLNSWRRHSARRTSGSIFRRGEPGSSSTGGGRGSGRSGRMLYHFVGSSSTGSTVSPVVICNPSSPARGARGNGGRDLTLWFVDARVLGNHGTQRGRKGFIPAGGWLPEKARATAAAERMAPAPAHGRARVP